MNVCVFTGCFTENPILEHENGVDVVEFVLIIYNYRKTKTGEKSRIPTYLTFEAWHTGAKTICNLAKKGTKITVHASARNVEKDCDDIVFRVNEFDFPCLDK